MKRSDIKYYLGRLSAVAPALLMWCVPFLLIIPNLALSITETDYSMAERLCNVLLPLGVYLTVMSSRRRVGWMTVIMFPIMVLCAFQIVLLFLYGRSIIAIDMFLNVVTTNVHEATELLRNLTGAVATVLIIYLPALAAAIWMIVCEHYTKASERRPAFRAGIILCIAGVGALLWNVASEGGYAADRKLFPVNVMSNICVATVRTAEAKEYESTSADFRFKATSLRPADEPEVYVVVVGETARAGNWQLNGYDRATNPRLSVRQGLVNFPRVLTQSNTTHKSVPLMLSHLDAGAFGDSIYEVKGIISAFAEAGYETAYFSNQVRNGSLIDSFGEEADTCVFITDDGAMHYDGELIHLLQRFLRGAATKKFVVLHTYGSHFNYRERYPEAFNHFRPDDSSSANAANRPALINSYDNTVLYIDAVLDSIAGTLASLDAPAAMIYAADHGEDIYDDSRNRFLHASPTPTYRQLHVPMLIWMSDAYKAAHPDKAHAVEAHARADVASSRCVFHTIVDMATVDTPVYHADASLASPEYREESPVFLNDYNEAVTLAQSGINSDDITMIDALGYDVEGAGSVLAVMTEKPSVGIENLAFGHKSHIMTVGIDDRQVPGTGVVETFHDFVHLVVKADATGWH